MDQTTIENLAQQLVDLQLQLKELDKEKELLKLDLWDNVKGGIKCQGGTVYWVNPSTEHRFDLTKLKEVLRNVGLSEITIEEIMEGSRVEKQRDPSIIVRLDR